MIGMTKVPDEFSYIMKSMEPPTIEEELEMEKSIREALMMTDINELRRTIESILRQNHQQGVFISRCLDKIHYLYAKIACIENRVEQPEPSWWTKFLSKWYP